MRTDSASSRGRRRLLGAIALVGGLVACDSAPTVCTLELRVALRPADTTLYVGQTVEPSARLASCGGRQQLPVRLVLTSSDTSIARIEPDARRIHAVGPGTLSISVTDSSYGFLGLIDLTVVPAP